MAEAEREAWACARAQQGHSGGGTAGTGPQHSASYTVPVSSSLRERGPGVAPAGTVSQLPRPACHADDSSGGGGGRWVSLIQCQQPQPSACGKGSSVPTMRLDSGIPTPGLGGGVLAVVVGVSGFGARGKVVTHGKRDGQVGLGQHLSASVSVTAQPWELGGSQSRGRGMGGSLSARPALPAPGKDGQGTGPRV